MCSLRRLAVTCILATVAAGCTHATPTATNAEPLIRARLVGQSRDALFACAGPPLRERRQQTLTLLRYYRAVEDDAPASAGQQPRQRPGCWAEVVVKDNRIADVHYVSVPATVDSSDHCDEIFVNCSF